MLKALLHSDLGNDGILKGVETEEERWVAVVYLVEKLSALL